MRSLHSTWLDGYSEDGSRSVSGRGCVTTAKDGNKVKITANGTGTSYAKAIGCGKRPTTTTRSTASSVSAPTEAGNAAPAARPILNGSGQVTGCSLDTTVPAKDISLYELHWGFGRNAATTPTAVAEVAEVANTIYPLW
ncbi:hypothetical protein AB0D54_24590 [Streptomyces xanthophaeus]|uniref:hypothetical protein n=1 Tax=Streptomyces xanthophaeus TaxID=67385 RepID=UPI003429A287